jgi:hypothetical protein
MIEPMDDGSWFTRAENRDMLLEDLADNSIFYEIEDLGVESEYIQIIYID